MHTELVIKNGTIVMSDKVCIADLYIGSGKIIAIEEHGENYTQVDDVKETIDARGYIILPGLIDIHVHFREPGQVYKEDIFTGTCAAAAGGVTTICDMPNNIPPITTAERFIEKSEMFKRKSVVDYGLFASATGVDDFPKFNDLGAIGIKLYMEIARTKHSPYGHLTVTDDGEMWDIFCQASKSGLTIFVHLDTPSITNKLISRLKTMPPTWEHYYALQNSVSAEIALAKVLVMAEGSGSNLHICHVPSVRCLERIKKEKKLGVKFTAECCLPAIDMEDLLLLGAYATPFGRPASENESFWQCLKEGVLDCVVTDHAPHTREEKDLGNGDVWAPPPGVPGLETFLSVLLTRVNQGLLSLHDLTKIACSSPARVIGIDHRKGSIEIGKDADLVLIDMKAEWKVKNERLYTKCGWSPFFGKILVGRPVMTILRGEIIMRDGKIIGEPGTGEMLQLRVKK